MVHSLLLTTDLDFFSYFAQLLNVYIVLNCTRAVGTGGERMRKSQLNELKVQTTVEFSL